MTVVELPSVDSADTTSLALAPEPLLTIGVEQGDPVREFHRVAVVRFLGADALAVASRGTADIRLFSLDGTHIRTLGRAGAGPGEFGSPSWMQTFGDGTIAVLDSEMRRATMFDGVGNLLSTVSFDGLDGYPWPRDFRMPDGGFAMFFDAIDLFDRIRAGEVHVGETARVDMPMLLLDASGTLRDTIGVFAGPEYAIVESDGRVGLGSPPFGRIVTHAIDATGVWIGTQQTFDIAHWTFDGELTHRLRDLSMDLTIVEADLLEHAGWLADRQNADAARRALITDALLGQPRPPTRAAHGEIRVAPSGEVWVAEPAMLPRRPAYWTVIDPATGSISRVLLPPDFQLFDVADDRVVGLHTDELDVQRIRVYELVR